MVLSVRKGIPYTCTLVVSLHALATGVYDCRTYYVTNNAVLWFTRMSVVGGKSISGSVRYPQIYSEVDNATARHPKQHDWLDSRQRRRKSTQRSLWSQVLQSGNKPWNRSSSFNQPSDKNCGTASSTKRGDKDSPPLSYTHCRAILVAEILLCKALIKKTAFTILTETAQCLESCKTLHMNSILRAQKILRSFPFSNGESKKLLLSMAVPSVSLLLCSLTRHQGDQGSHHRPWAMSRRRWFLVIDCDAMTSRDLLRRPNSRGHMKGCLCLLNADIRCYSWDGVNFSDSSFL